MSASLPAFEPIPVPSRVAFLREARIAADLAGGLRHLSQALAAARGANEPVLLLPGFMAGDASMWPLRLFLRRLGWDARGWELGFNRGDAPRLLPRVIEVADRLAQQRGQALRVVGWSMGGFMARELARDRADLVARVITMGTPVVGGPKYTAAAPIFRSRGWDLDAVEAECEARASRPIEAPITAIYSRRDGVVAWQACLDRTSPRIEHVEVQSTHAGLGFDGRVWQIIVDRLGRRAARRRGGRARSQRALAPPRAAPDLSHCA
jgi:pimeloyl-ACP methyl ester carboxylesterase